jgi:hypothetical protein
MADRKLTDAAAVADGGGGSCWSSWAEMRMRNSAVVVVVAVAAFSKAARNTPCRIGLRLSLLEQWNVVFVADNVVVVADAAFAVAVFGVVWQPRPSLVVVDVVDENNCYY